MHADVGQQAHILYRHLLSISKTTRDLLLTWQQASGNNVRPGITAVNWYKLLKLVEPPGELAADYLARGLVAYTTLTI